MTEKEKAIDLIEKLKECAYNHAYFGTDIAVDLDTAISCVEEVFNVEDPEWE